MTPYFIFYGFNISDAYSNLLVKLESKLHLLVLLYVDDMIINEDNEVEISKLKSDLLVQFDIRILGEVGYFLSLEIVKLDDGYFIS